MAADNFSDVIWQLQLVHTFVSNWPVIFKTSATSSARDPDRLVPTLYRLKNCFVYLNLQYADSEELVADKDRRSGVATITSSSLYFDKQVKAFVKASSHSVSCEDRADRNKRLSEPASRVTCMIAKET
jgi:hypothetical protein